jgi:hypothetical protein
MSGMGLTATVLVGAALIAWWVRFSVRRRAVDRWSKTHGLNSAKSLLRAVDPDRYGSLLQQVATIVRNWKRPE